MSYHSNYEGYKPLFCESDNDDVPMMSRERYAPPRHYQDEWNQPYQSRSWNDEPSITKEIEQPEMSNLERLLKEAIEHTERQSREWDDVLDWNIESNQERPYDTFTNATEHLDDVEAIEHNDYYPNIDVTYSSNIVFQDDSEDEMDEEEEENEVTNYPHETSQIVLQDSYMLEPEVTKDAIVDYDADIKELQGLMGISDHDLDELVKMGVGDDLILELEFENLYRASSTQALEVDRLATLEMSSECVYPNYVEEPTDYLCILAKDFSEDVGITCHSYLKVAIIRIIIIPLKKWRGYSHITSCSWRMFYRNVKTKEDILLCEYDEKGGGSMIEDWL